MRDIGKLKYSELTSAERKRVAVIEKRRANVQNEKVTVTGGPKAKKTAKKTTKSK